jgi:hypothetical protein
VDLIKFSEKIMDKENIESKVTIEFRVWNSLRELSISKKRIYFGESSRFYEKEIDSRLIIDKVLQKRIITLKLFQSEQLMKINQIFGYVLEIE